MSIRRVYETTFIVNAAIEDQDIESVISKVSSYIENNGGEIMDINRWGRRRLAYPINKKFNGYYVHFIFEAKPSLIPILERFLVLEDTVLRHLTLILPKKLFDYRIRLQKETGRTYDQAFADTTETKVGESKIVKTSEDIPIIEYPDIVEIVEEEAEIDPLIEDEIELDDQIE